MRMLLKPVLIALLMLAPLSMMIKDVMPDRSLPPQWVLDEMGVMVVRDSPWWESFQFWLTFMCGYALALVVDWKPRRED